MVSVQLVVTEVVQTPHGQKHVTLHLNVAYRGVQTEETSVLMDTLVDSVLLNGGSVQDSVTALDNKQNQLKPLLLEQT